ncbi:MAG TPA: caspase family protein [Polyangiales bacterium]
MRAASWMLLLSLTWPSVAQAHVERFAVLVANDQGASDEAQLRYAESDASRMYDVLRDLGDFAPVNMVLLRNEHADTVRSTLIAVNERIREAMSLPDTQVVLLVYYSGHADAESLHLGGTKLAIRELTQLVRGSAASFRLVVLDACRSGALTRLKGGRVVAPFALGDDASLAGDGLAFLTASSANEDAQESDELGGSFFTHALVSGLLGAADQDGDGNVVLDEAYRYAYDATLRATSRTFAGTQHPSFRYDFRGQGELVLTRPQSYAQQRASLVFPQGMSFLLMREHADGQVVAELSEHAGSHSLSVRPGRYFVRARSAQVLYEGALAAAAGTTTAVDVDRMTRIEYARLVRKGGSDAHVAQGLEAGARVRSVLPNAATACVGGFVGYGLDWTHFGLRARASACTSQFDNAPLHAVTNAYDLELRLQHAWDLSRVSFELGLGGGASLLTQRFETAGRAADRDSLAPFLALGAGAGIDLSHGFYTGLDLAAETHFLSLADASPQAPRTQVSFAMRASLLAGKRF